MKKSHSPNCLCGNCTSFDPHITHIRSQFGKNADFTNTLNGGSQYGFNDYENHFGPETGTTVTPAPDSSKKNAIKIFGDAIGNVLGDLIQTKKDGGNLPPILDKVAGLGILTEQAAVKAATGKTESVVGQNVLKFSPYIIAGLVGVVLLVVVLLVKKK